MTTGLALQGDKVTDTLIRGLFYLQAIFFLNVSKFCLEQKSSVFRI